MKRNKKGFTLIELMISIAIVAIIAAILLPIIAGGGKNSNISVGINGFTEVRCINNYQFVVGDRGHVTQVMDEEGHGVPCP